MEAAYATAGAAFPPGPEAGIARALTSLAGAQRPEELLERTPTTVVRCMGFRRVALYRVEQSVRIPVTAGTGGDLPLDPVEREVVRRRVPALVPGSHVVVPITAGGVAIGLLHGVPMGAPDAQHRDLLHAFAAGFGHLFERTVLTARLTATAERARTFASSLTTALVPAEEPAVRLAPLGGAAVARVPLAPVPNRADPAQLVLTARQLEVMELLAAGRTNAEIADALTITTGTVKSHVKHILRRLRAANRADAVSRYLRLARAA